ncbi:MAG: MBL fold metallo-hydrolase [Oscillospiraceae bacterium]|nr:MBL fold metallo-hydrolase [Oscillospiraceae bacterium]
MLIKSFTLGHIQTNCYIVTDENTLECAVIDPGAESNTVMRYLEENKLKCRFILLTHGHFDHTGAVEDVMKQTGATVCMSRKDVRKVITEMGYKYAPPKGTVFFKEGDSFTVGSLVFEVIETPGHSEGSVVFRCGDALFTGDTLFKDSCGRTDLPGCSGRDMMKSLKKLAELPGDYEVYPGHMEGTSLDRERRFNYFMRQAMEE